MNRQLANRLNQMLNDPSEPYQLSPLIRDHDQFRRLLLATPSKYRQEMYAALVRDLRFKARTFDEYMKRSVQ